ncbi:hypothetical protein EZ315_08615 [Duncaniella freteri]|uniref:Uncharacterized protein n=1 Tax=Duncaniella freteri TaxID=2530391 RepID=A0A4Z0VAY2_9BACT|nr:hypothetical protein [Duncaniella freteri]TGG40718.1 hypothetical protein EZ315_08615 [Duncaniella freteri]
MEITIPQNASGFNRKPKSKSGKSDRSRKTRNRRPGNNPIDELPADANAWLFGSMFLMAAARLLAPFFSYGQAKTTAPSATPE